MSMNIIRRLIVTFMILPGYARYQMLTSALNVYDQMAASDDSQPDMVTFSVLIRALSCGPQGKMDKVGELLGKWIR
jgi:hypothetical protein